MSLTIEELKKIAREAKTATGDVIEETPNKTYTELNEIEKAKRMHALKFRTGVNPTADVTYPVGEVSKYLKQCYVIRVNDFGDLIYRLNEPNAYYELLTERGRHNMSVCLHWKFPYINRSVLEYILKGIQEYQTQFLN